MDSLLHVGDTVLTHGEQCSVIMVNECRARVVPLARRTVVFTPVTTGTETSFQASRRGWDISPNSEIKIISRKKKR